MACTTCNDGTCLTPETCERLRNGGYEPMTKRWPDGWRCPYCKTEFRVPGRTPVVAPCKSCEAGRQGG